MIGAFKTPILCDRRVYDKKGSWKNPQNDIADNIFYFVKEPLGLTTSYINGREEIKESVTIVVFGGKPMAQYDEITLDNGKKYSVQNITYNFVEHNILVKDLLKPLISNMEIELA